MKGQNSRKLPFEVRYCCMRSYSTASDPCSTTSRKVRPLATVLSLSLPARLHWAADPPIWKESYHPLRCSREKAQAELGSVFSPLGERTREPAKCWMRLERVHPDAKWMRERPGTAGESWRLLCLDAFRGTCTSCMALLRCDLKDNICMSRDQDYGMDSGKESDLGANKRRFSASTMS